MIEFLEARIAPALVLTHTGQLGNHTLSDDLVATDNSGNIIVVGRFTGVLDLDMTSGVDNVSTSDPDGDLFIAAYDSNFNLVWKQTWGGTGVEQATDVLTNGPGDIFVTGQFGSASAGFGGSGSLSATAGSPQAFVLKLQHGTGLADTSFSSDGQLSFGNGTNVTIGRTLALDPDGLLLVGGDFSGSANGIEGSGLMDAIDGIDGFVIRLTTGGTTDASFGNAGSDGGLVISNSGTVFDSVFRIELNGSGEVFVGSHSLTVLPQASFEGVDVTRFSTSGSSLVSTFGSGGTLTIGSVVPQLGNIDFDLDSSGRVVTVQSANGAAVVLFRYQEATGEEDTTFGSGQSHAGLLAAPAKTASILIGQDGFIYVGGTTATKDYVGRLKSNGLVDTTFASNGVALFGGTVQGLEPTKLAMALDGDGKLIIRDTFQGSPDFDPSKSVKKLTERSIFVNSSTMSDGFLVRFDPNGLAAGQSLTIPAGFDQGGRPVSIVVTFTGPGRVEVIEAEEAPPGTIERIELFDTTLASKLTVKVINPISGMSVRGIVTNGVAQDMGTIILAPELSLGAAFDDGQADLLISGRSTNIVLGDLTASTLIQLGKDLPYNAVDPNVSDTYNNKPNLTIGNVLASGVVIDVTGDGITPQGVGGGGLGTVIVKSWASPGVLKTTQSIGSFTVLQGDFGAILEVDKFGLGESTTANVGSMTIANGDWGSSGSVIEGSIGVFDVEEFLASASIQAGSVRSVRTTDGGFSGTLTLTDIEAKGIATFTVAADFTGKIVSASPLKKLAIKGDFKGSLSAPSIAGITALSFDGTTVGDMEGDAERLNITTTAGLLGFITAKSGLIKNFEFNTPGNFSGIKVVKSGLLEPTVGIENISVTAANIGPVTVQLAGKSTALGLNLTGILNSSFITAGKMGAVTVKVAGASAASIGMQNVDFTANALGNVLVSVAKGKAVGATARGVVDVDITSTTTIGAVSVIGDATLPQAMALNIWAGGKIGGLAVKSKTAANGILQDSKVLAGQSLDLSGITDLKTLKSRLAAASLGAVSVAGSVNGSLIAAGATVAAVNVGGNLSQSIITGGALLGADRKVGGGDDTFHLGGQIGGVTVKANFDRSSVAVGVKAGDGVFGNGDTIADSIGSFALVSAIKSLTIGGGVAALAGPIAGVPSYGIEAGKIGKLSVNKVASTDFTVPFLLDADPAGESANDVLVRIVS